MTRNTGRGGLSRDLNVRLQAPRLILSCITLQRCTIFTYNARHLLRQLRKSKNIELSSKGRRYTRPDGLGLSTTRCLASLASAVSGGVGERLTMLAPFDSGSAIDYGYFRPLKSFPIKYAPITIQKWRSERTGLTVVVGSHSTPIVRKSWGS